MIRNNRNGIGNDKYCKILLKGETPRSTITPPAGYFMEDSIGGEHACKLFGTNYTIPVQDNSIKRFGKNSWHMPQSSGDVGILIEDSLHSDWILGDSDFTIDFWQYDSGISGTPSMFVAGVQLDSSNYWGINYSVTGVPNVLNVHFTVKVEGTSNLALSYVNTATAFTFNHYAVVKYNDTVTLYLNGIAMTSGTLATMPTINSNFRVGTFCGMGCTDNNFHIDEFRYSKGIARWINNFTPPNRGY